MPGLDGTGPLGMGPMTGGGRGFCSPWGIGAFMRTYGIPGRWAYGHAYRPRWWFAPWAMPFIPLRSREQGLSFLRRQADLMKAGLDEVEARIEELSKETK